MEPDRLRAGPRHSLTIGGQSAASICQYELNFAVHGQSRPALRFAAAQGIVLELLRHTDPDATAALHDANERKALAISPISVSPVSSGLARATLHLASWNRALVDLLDAAFRTSTNARLSLCGAPALLLDWQLEGSWTPADFLALPALVEVEVRFASPTFFSFGRYSNETARYHVLPDPGIVMASWLRAWKLTGDRSLDWLPRSPEELGRLIALASLRDLRTVRADEPAAHLTGFIGLARYRWAGVEPAGRRALTTLAAFSAICGTGAKTGRGFGQTIPLAPAPIMHGAPAHGGG